jgi:hypothetical protein
MARWLLVVGPIDRDSSWAESKNPTAYKISAEKFGPTAPINPAIYHGIGLAPSLSGLDCRKRKAILV